jgi:hypothetical protein
MYKRGNRLTSRTEAKAVRDRDRCYSIGEIWTPKSRGIESNTDYGLAGNGLRWSGPLAADQESDRFVSDQRCGNVLGGKAPTL